MFRSTVFCWENFQGLLPSSFISISEIIIFHLQRQKLQLAATGEKTNDIILALEKMIYIDIRYKSAQFRKRTVTERYQRQGGYSNLNSSTLNQVLDISAKQICLSLSDVAVSLRRACWCTGVKTSSLDKPLHRVKVGFIEGDLIAYSVPVYFLVKKPT